MTVLLSFLGGVALGFIHFRMYHRMLDHLMQKPVDAPFKRHAVVVGLFRHIFTLSAGILLIRVARLDPFPLCGGVLFAVAVYRAYTLAKAK